MGKGKDLSRLGGGIGTRGPGESKLESDRRHLKEKVVALEKKLAEANPSMGAKVAAGICGATKLNIVEPETYMLYRDLMVAKGTASGQVKPVSIITNELQRKFFFGLTEYGVELVK